MDLLEWRIEQREEFAGWRNSEHQPGRVCSSYHISALVQRKRNYICLVCVDEHRCFACNVYLVDDAFVAGARVQRRSSGVEDQRPDVLVARIAEDRLLPAGSYLVD